MKFIPYIGVDEWSHPWEPTLVSSVYIFTLKQSVSIKWDIFRHSSAQYQAPVKLIVPLLFVSFVMAFVHDRMSQWGSIKFYSIWQSYRWCSGILMCKLEHSNLGMKISNLSVVLCYYLRSWIWYKIMFLFRTFWAEFPRNQIMSCIWGSYLCLYNVSWGFNYYPNSYFCFRLSFSLAQVSFIQFPFTKYAVLYLLMIVFMVVLY